MNSTQKSFFELFPSQRKETRSSNTLNHFIFLLFLQIANALIPHRFAEEELAKHQLSASQKWGFDFVRGCPMEDTKLFMWERVPPTNEIPEMYTLSRAAHMRPIDPDRTPSKKRRHTRRDSFLDLYDDLADESNRYVPPRKSSKLDLSFEDIDGSTSASSCDEESFEEDDDNLLCDINWMPGTSAKIPANRAPAVVPPQSATATTTTCGDTVSAAPANPQCSTIANSSCDTSSSTTAINANKSCPSTSNSSTRILRSSPRNREKRQLQITGELTRKKQNESYPQNHNSHCCDVNILWHFNRTS